MLAVETIGLTRRFGARTAVAGVDLKVPAGAIYGFLGPNGAGKTTTLRMILGILRADAGKVRLFDGTATCVGAMVEMPVVYDHLTGRENLVITCRLLGIARSEVDRVLDIVDLRGAADRRAGGYSLGMRQRLGLARALIGEPALLVLDEPSNGLDPDGMRDMRGLLRRLVDEAGVTILVSSHLLAEIDQIADHVGLMRDGRLVAQGPLRDIMGAGDLLDIEVSDVAKASVLLAGLCAGVSVDGQRLSVRLNGGATPADANHALVTGGIAVDRLALRKPSLEDAYLATASGGPS